MVHQLALLVVSHCPSKNRNPSKQDDLSQTIFHVTVSIFWELDISIQDYEVQGGTKEDLNRDALEAAKDDAWEAQISNSPSWLDLLCWKFIMQYAWIWCFRMCILVIMVILVWYVRDVGYILIWYDTMIPMLWYYDTMSWLCLRNGASKHGIYQFQFSLGTCLKKSENAKATPSLVDEWDKHMEAFWKGMFNYHMISTGAYDFVHWQHHGIWHAARHHLIFFV